MIKCEVLADKVCLIVEKGSIVYVDERQFELARQFIRPVEKAKAEGVEEKPKKSKK